MTLGPLSHDEGKAHAEPVHARLALSVDPSMRTASGPGREPGDLPVATFPTASGTRGAVCSARLRRVRV